MFKYINRFLFKHTKKKSCKIFFICLIWKHIFNLELIITYKVIKQHEYEENIIFGFIFVLFRVIHTEQHTERYLPRPENLNFYCRNRLLSNCQFVFEFLKEKDVVLKGRLLQFKINIIYMTDLSAKFHAINLQF